jgi:hypothetical protein
VERPETVSRSVIAASISRRGDGFCGGHPEFDDPEGVMVLDKHPELLRELTRG